MTESASAELFDLPPSLLNWLPGETLFSLVSRQHAFWGYPGAGETSTILFGRRQAGIHHDFPNELDGFCARTGGVLGAPDDLALDHTLLSYYRPFSSDRLISDCLAMMRGKSVNHLKYRLGLLTSSFRANHPLKACTICMDQDVAETGWAYWHLEHQYPGIWFCERHAEPLHEATIKSTGVNRFLWALPDRRHLTLDWLQKLTDAQALMGLTSTTLQLLRQNRATGWLDGAHVVPVLREAIRQKDWLTPNGNLRVNDLTPSYLAWAQKLHGPLELNALPSNVLEAASQIGRLLRPWRTGTHPLRVLVLISWLFDSVEAFLAAYDSCNAPGGHSSEPESPDSARPCVSAPKNDEIRAQLVTHVRAGMSATAAASAARVTVGTAMAWLAQAGVKVSRRPKTLTPAIQEVLRTDLLQGLDKTTAANKHGISVQAVTRFLRTEPGLHQTWQQAIFLTRQTQARSAWAAALATDGHLGANWLRAQDPSRYAWLYRNDRTWLQGNLPPVVARTPVASRVDWDERDLVLSAEAEQTLEDLKAAQPNKPVQLWQLYQAMPQLKPKLSALDRLPLTRRVIERGLRRSKVKLLKDLL